MTKRITSEDCEGNIEDIEDGRYNTHVVPVSAEDDPGYEEIDYGDCTEFTVPLGRYGSHVVPIGGGGGAAGAACPNGGLKAGTNIDGKDCLSVNLKQDGAIILDNGQLAIDTSKLKITTDQVYPSGTDTGIVIDGPDGESWDTQYDYNQWLYNEITNIDHSDYVTHTELMLDQQRQDMALIVDQRNQDAKWAKDQERQDLEYEAKFVEVEGDTMTGDLIVKADVHTNRVDTTFIDSGENSNLKLQHNGITKVYVGREQVTITNPLQLNTEGTDDNHAVTKKYIDDTKDYLQQEIIELEEEIDAIAPSVERGRWTFTAVGTVGQPGQFTMYDADFGYGSPTGLFKSAKSIWFNEIDIDGTPHSFADVDDGELLEIFIDGSPEYGLYEVVGQAHDETQTGTKFWVIDVNFVRTNETTTAVDPAELCRFKIFMAPTGGDASSFVMKSGDKMTGDLTIDRTTDGNTDVESRLTIEGSRPSSQHSAATIKFINDQTNDTGFLTYRSGSGGNWFAFNRDLDLNNNGLHSVAQIRLQSGGYIGSGNNPRLIFNNPGSGNEGDGLLVVPRPYDNRRGFVIRGNDVDGNEKDLLYSYTNYSGTPDAVNYHGKMDSGQNLVNKAYVDAAASAGGLFKPNEEWNRANSRDVTYDLINWSHGKTFPQNEKEITLYDDNNQIMGSMGRLSSVRRIAYMPYGGTTGWEAGYTGLITFGMGGYNSTPSVVFQVYDLERTGAYWSWRVVNIFPQYGTVQPKVEDLKDKNMNLRGGAVYKV